EAPPLPHPLHAEEEPAHGRRPLARGPPLLRDEVELAVGLPVRGDVEAAVDEAAEDLRLRERVAPPAGEQAVERPRRRELGEDAAVEEVEEVPGPGPPARAPREVPPLHLLARLDAAGVGAAHRELRVDGAEERVEVAGVVGLAEVRDVPG